MAIKIPDAPNIIGSEPVLRSPQGINGSTATPQFKTNVSAINDATNAVGTLLANVNQERVDTYMTQASLWWTENMNKHMREVQDKYKGAAAMDLYVKEIKPYANKLTKDLFGSPKNDGMVRIANPDLQKAFQKWADGQMRNYNAQIGHYEGQELARYNESTFDAREQQISEGLLAATTPEEIVGYSQSMLDLNRVRYRGYNPDRISQLAAAKVDAAVAKNVEAQINNNVEVGYNYYTDPQVQAALSSGSKAALQQSLRKALVEQGKARGGEGLANNDSERVAYYTNQKLIQQIYNTEDPEIIRGVQMEIMGGANDRAKALTEKAAGVQSQIAAGLSADLANATNEDEFYTALEKVYEFDPVWGKALDDANERDALDARLVRFVSSAAPDYDKEVSRLTDVITEELNNPVAPKLYGRGSEKVQAQLFDAESAYAGRTVNSAERESALAAQVKEYEMSGLSHDDAVRKVARDEAGLIAIQDEDNPAKLEAMAEYNVLRDRLAKDGEIYTAVMNDIVAGTYTGGRDDRVNALPLYMQRDLYAAVGTEGEYRRLVNSHPGVDEVFKDVDATYTNLDVGYKERAKRMAMKRVSDWERKNGDTAKGQQLRQLVEQGYTDAKDPVSNALESAIRDPLSVDDLRDMDYWSREQRTDIMAEQGRAGAIVEAATGAFSEPGKVKTKVGDRSWDKQTATAEARIKNFKKNLPTELRYVVEQNMDLYVNWYRLGNTNAIINHVNAHRNKY